MKRQEHYDVITGSAHRNGTSALLADKFIEGAKEAGPDVFRFDAAFKNIHGCIGCDTCNKKGNGCVYKDDMEELNPHLLEADVIVFSSPHLYFNINAQVKSVIDRFYINNSALQGNRKIALLLSMADIPTESAEASEIFFKHFADYMSWENLGVISSTNSWTRANFIAHALKERGVPASQITKRNQGGTNEYSPIEANRQPKVILHNQ